jgi:hypothetical protein
MKKLWLAAGIVMSSVFVNAQTPSSTPAKKRTDNYPQNSRQHTSPNKTNARVPTGSRQGSSSQPVTNPDQRTAIPPASRTAPVSNVKGRSTNNAKKSPFVGGIYAAPNAAQPAFDTVGSAMSRNPNAIKNPTQAGVTIAGGNDTTFNAHSLNTQGVGTASGAEDRSGQSQFGQTNWGRNERNTVGESQWTVPPPITASFNRDFPAQNAATWTRNNVDTNMYSVRYQSGATWIMSTYNATGNRVDTRTEIPLTQAPRPVNSFIQKQPSTFKVTTISKLQIQGKPDMYELRLSNGKTAYVNNDGMEVNL